MVSSVSSKYLNYNTGPKEHTFRTADNAGNNNESNHTDRVDVMGLKGVGSFHEYRHIYSDLQSNEANVSWIIKLREGADTAGSVAHGNSSLSPSRIEG